MITKNTRGISRQEFLKLLETAAAAAILTGCGVDQTPAAPSQAPTTSVTLKPTAISTYSAEDFSRMAYCGIRC